jgi:hypothetical protein
VHVGIATLGDVAIDVDPTRLKAAGIIDTGLEGECGYPAHERCNTALSAHPAAVAVHGNASHRRWSERFFDKPGTATSLDKTKGPIGAFVLLAIRRFLRGRYAHLRTNFPVPQKFSGNLQNYGAERQAKVTAVYVQRYPMSLARQTR